MLKTATFGTLLVLGMSLSGGQPVATSSYAYSERYTSVIEGAKKEGELILYSNVHSPLMENGIIAAFHKRYPFVSVKTYDAESGVIYQRFTKEIADGRPSADLVWSSAMDLQEKLINDGYAQNYSSPEQSFLPSWAKWKNLGYGVTSDPIVFVFNRRFVSEREAPRTHAALQKMLHHQRIRFKGRVAIYNLKNSETGMLLASQDVLATPDSWNLFRAFGEVDAHTYLTSSEMLRDVASGDQWIAYNVISPYALEMRKSNADLMVVYPSDYVLTLTRVAFISAKAMHPNAARLFLDFLISRSTQKLFESYGEEPVRTDMARDATPIQLDTTRIRAIRLGPGLLAGLDTLVQAQFLREWRKVNLEAHDVKASEE